MEADDLCDAAVDRRERLAHGRFWGPARASRGQPTHPEHVCELSDRQSHWREVQQELPHKFGAEMSYLTAYIYAAFQEFPTKLLPLSAESSTSDLLGAAQRLNWPMVLIN